MLQTHSGSLWLVLGVHVSTVDRRPISTLQVTSAVPLHEQATPLRVYPPLAASLTRFSLGCGPPVSWSVGTRDILCSISSKSVDSICPFTSTSPARPSPRPKTPVRPSPPPRRSSGFQGKLHLASEFAFAGPWRRRRSYTSPRPTTAPVRASEPWLLPLSLSTAPAFGPLFLSPWVSSNAGRAWRGCVFCCRSGGCPHEGGLRRQPRPPQRYSACCSQFPLFGSVV
jgi:hypothetical protein